MTRPLHQTALLLCVVTANVLGLACAALQPSLLFGDNMVLPTDVPANLFGTASPNALVKLSGTPDGRTYTATASSSGDWLLTVDAYSPPTPAVSLFSLTLRTPVDTVVAVNVTYGTVVWCGGQSNMALNVHPLYDNVSILDAAHRPDIRLFKVPDAFSTTPNTVLPNGSAWFQTTPSVLSSSDFSGLCYLTAIQLKKARGQDVSTGAIGLIEAAIGSTDIQSWMSAEARDTALKTCWTGSSPLPPSHSHSPPGGLAASELYNAMVAPLLPYSLNFMLWDQGENNAAYCVESEYNCLLYSMITDLRSKFGGGSPSFPPALWVQLGGYASSDNLTLSNVAIRAALGDTLMAGPVQYSNATHVNRLENSAMAMSYDLGSPEFGDPSNHWWIHARNKTEIGRRLALKMAMLADDPAAKGREFVGPVVSSTWLEHDPATGKPLAYVNFTHDDGLALLPAQGCIQCCNQTDLRTPQTPYLFELANHKGVWHPAIGRVIPGTRTVSVEALTDVVGDWVAGVRYADVDIPQCVLYNSAQLPAGPFRYPVPFSA